MVSLKTISIVIMISSFLVGTTSLLFLLTLSTIGALFIVGILLCTISWKWMGEGDIEPGYELLLLSIGVVLLFAYLFVGIVEFGLLTVFPLLSYFISSLSYKYYGDIEDRRPPIQVQTPQPKSTEYGGWGSVKGARYFCNYCNKGFTKNRGRKDHERVCKMNPNRDVSYGKKKRTEPQPQKVIHHRETIIKEKEIIRERTFLICLNCQMRTEQGHPKCQHCGAPL